MILPAGQYQYFDSTGEVVFERETTAHRLEDGRVEVIILSEEELGATVQLTEKQLRSMGYISADVVQEAINSVFDATYTYTVMDDSNINLDFVRLSKRVALADVAEALDLESPYASTEKAKVKLVDENNYTPCMYGGCVDFIGGKLADIDDELPLPIDEGTGESAVDDLDWAEMFEDREAMAWETATGSLPVPEAGDRWFCDLLQREVTLATMASHVGIDVKIGVNPPGQCCRKL